MDMKGIILAAGRGSRMGSLTSDLPKCRTVLFGKELIQWQLDALYGAGIKDIAIIRGYLSKTFEFDLKYFENKRWKHTNMVSTLFEASDWLENHTCIVSYSDIVYSSNVVSSLINAKADISITYDPNWYDLWSMRFTNPLSDAETFKLNGDFVSEIGNKASSLSEINGQYMGLIKITPNGWNIIVNYLNNFSSHEIDMMDMTTLLRGLIGSNVNIYAVPISDLWMEVDSEEDVKIYQDEYNLSLISKVYNKNS
jgi:L-glutamine-phosphate cytidylyltransferase